LIVQYYWDLNEFLDNFLNLNNYWYLNFDYFLNYSINIYNSFDFNWYLNNLSLTSQKNWNFNNFLDLYWNLYNF